GTDAPGTNPSDYRNPNATPGTMAPETIHLERIRLSSAYQRNAWNDGTGNDTPGANPAIICTSAQRL
ncbi:hypothetical protein DRF58_17860, partial [Epilithonimonas hispanica]